MVGSVPVEPTRRSVLAGALAAGAAAALSGCTTGADRPAGPRPPDPDVVLADQAAARERALLAAYDEATARAPELADRLAPLRAEHADHLAALGVPTAAATPPASGPTAGPAPEPEPAVAAPALPADPAGLLAALADLERRAAVDAGGTAVRSGRGLAVVLASIAASEASHVAALA